MTEVLISNPIVRLRAKEILVLNTVVIPISIPFEVKKEARGRDWLYIGWRADVFFNFYVCVK